MVTTGGNPHPPVANRVFCGVCEGDNSSCSGCDPDDPDGCPDGFRCLHFADEHACFENRGTCGNGVIDGTDADGDGRLGASEAPDQTLSRDCHEPYERDPIRAVIP